MSDYTHNCILDIKDMLIKYSKAYDKIEKKNIIINVFNYLFENKEFVNDNRKFKIVVINKCKEFKINETEYEDLIEICDKILTEFEQESDDSDEE